MFWMPQISLFQDLQIHCVQQVDCSSVPRSSWEIMMRPCEEMVGRCKLSLFDREEM